MPTSNKTKIDNGRAWLDNKRKQLNNTALTLFLIHVAPPACNRTEVWRTADSKPDSTTSTSDKQQRDYWLNEMNVDSRERLHRLSTEATTESAEFQNRNSKKRESKIPGDCCSVVGRWAVVLGSAFHIPLILCSSPGFQAIPTATTLHSTVLCIVSVVRDRVAMETHQRYIWFHSKMPEHFKKTSSICFWVAELRLGPISEWNSNF